MPFFIFFRWETSFAKSTWTCKISPIPWDMPDWSETESLALFIGVFKFSNSVWTKSKVSLVKISAVIDEELTVVFDLFADNVCQVGLGPIGHSRHGNAFDIILHDNGGTLLAPCHRIASFSETISDLPDEPMGVCLLSIILLTVIAV